MNLKAKTSKVLCPFSKAKNSKKDEAMEYVYIVVIFYSTGNEVLCE